MMWIVLGLILWLIYDYYKDRKIEKELREIKQYFTKKGGAE